MDKEILETLQDISNTLKVLTADVREIKEELDGINRRKHLMNEMKKAQEEYLRHEREGDIMEYINSLGRGENKY